MILEAALAIAGTDAHLVGRPRGVAHVYAGPLTPSGRHVPKARRTVCRAHTGRLRLFPLPERWSSLRTDAASLPRLCARCTARLDRDRDRSRRATSHPLSRAQLRAEHVELSRADLAAALNLATSPGEVDAAAWLTLLLFDVAGCNKPFAERGRRWRSLHDQVHAARARVHGFPDDPLAAAAQHNRALGDAAAKARRREVARERRAGRGLTGDDRDHAQPT